MNLNPKKRKKAIDLSALCSTVRERLESMPKRDRVKYFGIGGVGKIEGVPTYISTENEHVVSQGNAFIVLGVDRPGDILSGYGGLGNTHCAAIDIVAGRMGARAACEDEDGDVVAVNSNFITDAARIYVSQKADVDNYFGLVGGSNTINTSEDSPRSTVALKADTIRVIGREGIKFVTGVDSQNSQTGPIIDNTGISLIAMNGGNPETPFEPPFDLQPMVKGKYLKECLDDLSKNLVDIRMLFYNFVTYQRDFNRTIICHTHNSPFYATPTSPSMAIIPEGIRSMINTVTKVETQIYTNMTSVNQWFATYVAEGGAKYINSAFHNLN